MSEHFVVSNDVNIWTIRTGLGYPVMLLTAAPVAVITSRRWPGCSMIWLKSFASSGAGAAGHNPFPIMI